MQDKDSETLRNQRRRRKRIARMKHTIIAIIAGWIILSMILIIFLLVRTRSMERKLDELWQMQRVMNQQVPDTEALPQEETSGMDTETVAVTAPASGIDETDNLAQDGDVHKVYLTFDDGPSENTDAILDVLSEYDVKATFFVVGKEDEASAAIYQRIVDEGHTLGMHSYSNKYSLIYQSEDAFEADFHQLQDYLYEVTGEKSRYYRFPGREQQSDQQCADEFADPVFKQRGRRLLRLERLGRRCGKCCIYTGRTGRECCFRCFKIQDLGCAFARLGR